MAHELSIRANGKAEMAFIGGETPWHGLGQAVSKGASVDVWRREAGMDWEAREAPVVFFPGTGKVEHRSIVESHKVIYRGDTCAPLGVVGSGYKIVQPREILDFFRTMTEQDGWHIHTAGVLRGGRKLWAMASNGQVESLSKKGDQVINQLLIATSLDGSMKTIVKECATVVVCANTLAVALREGGKGLVISHRSVFDERAIKRQLGLAQGAFDAFMLQARTMAATPIQLDAALTIVNGIFGTKPKEGAVKVEAGGWLGELKRMADPVNEEEPAPEDDERTARAAGRVLELFQGGALGASRSGRQGSNWGLFNAITQYVDHEMGRTPDTRLDSAWFGRGDTYKQQALAALAVA